MEPSLAVGALADAAVAGLFAYVGATVALRHVSSPSRPANRALAVWWLSIAFLWLLDGARALLADTSAAPVFVALHYAYVAGLCLALWGLLTYLVFLLRARDAARPLAVFYALYFVAAAIAIFLAGPDHIRVGAWATHVVYETPLPRVAEASFLLFLLVPQLVASGAYLIVARRVESPEQRYRGLLVGSALLLWIGINLAADLAALTYDDGWQIARRLVAAAASVAIVLAYRPPRFLRRRFERQEAAA